LGYTTVIDTLPVGKIS